MRRLLIATTNPQQASRDPAAAGGSVDRADHPRRPSADSRARRERAHLLGERAHQGAGLRPGQRSADGRRGLGARNRRARRRAWCLFGAIPQAGGDVPGAIRGDLSAVGAISGGRSPSAVRHRARDGQGARAAVRNGNGRGRPYRVGSGRNPRLRLRPDLLLRSAGQDDGRADRPGEIRDLTPRPSVPEP